MKLQLPKFPLLYKRNIVSRHRLKVHEAATKLKLRRSGSDQCLVGKPSGNTMYVTWSSMMEEEWDTNLINYGNNIK